MKEENPQIPEEAIEIMDCHRAIEIYWSGYYEYQKSEMTDEEIKNDALEHAFNDAEKLASGTDMRYGAPGLGGTKLEYGILRGEGDKYFYLRQNGMDDEKFKKWQEYIGKKFEEEGLRFNYF
jgi:hypothetical protein